MPYQKRFRCSFQWLWLFWSSVTRRKTSCVFRVQGKFVVCVGFRQFPPRAVSRSIMWCGHSGQNERMWGIRGRRFFTLFYVYSTCMENYDLLLVVNLSLCFLLPLLSLFVTIRRHQSSCNFSFLFSSSHTFTTPWQFVLIWQLKLKKSTTILSITVALFLSAGLGCLCI